MKKTAIFPGSFDPITKGHEALVIRALNLFDKIIVAIGTNSSKKYMFSLEKRVELIEKVFINEPRVSVKSYEGLTVDFCEQENAQFILRGLRTSADFEFERAIAQVNAQLQNSIESVFLITSPKLSAINSSIVRDIIINGGDATAFIPEEIAKDIY